MVLHFKQDTPCTIIYFKKLFAHTKVKVNTDQKQPEISLGLNYLKNDDNRYRVPDNIGLCRC